jgi:hypothetical protein
MTQLDHPAMGTSAEMLDQLMVLTLLSLANRANSIPRKSCPNASHCFQCSISGYNRLGPLGIIDYFLSRKTGDFFTLPIPIDNETFCIESA